MSPRDRQPIRSIALFEELHRRKQMTPDVSDLCGLEEHLVFIYDEYKRGFALHEYLNGAKYLGSARTIDNSFQLMVTPSGSLPILLSGDHLKTENKANYHSCKGEVYALTVNQMILLDQIHENTRLFERQQKYCVLEDQVSPFKVDPASGQKPPLARQCHVYIGIPQVWEHCQLHFATKSHTNSRTFWDWKKNPVNKYATMH